MAVNLDMPDHLIYFHDTYDSWYLRQDVEQWLETNDIVYESYTDIFNTKLTVYFKKEDDAALFKLWWFG